MRYLKQHYQTPATTKVFFFLYEFNILWQYNMEQEGFLNSGTSQNRVATFHLDYHMCLHYRQYPSELEQ